MTKQRKSDEIGELALFRGCSRREREWLGKHADTVDVPAGTTLALSFARSKEFAIVASGVARATSSTGDVLLGPGSYFGEMSLLDGRCDGLTIEARSPMRLFVLDERAFRAMLVELPVVGRKLMVELVAKLRRLEEAMPAAS